MRFLAVLLMCPFLVYGAGFQNPDFKDVRYSMILVVTPTSDVDFRDKMEKWVASEIRDNGGEAVTYLSLFSPAKRYNENEVKTILIGAKVDAVLVVALGSDTRESQLFGALSNTQPLGYGSMTTVAPLVANKRRATASMTLFDFASGQSAWVGTAEATVRGFKAKSETSVFENLARVWRRN